MRSILLILAILKRQVIGQTLGTDLAPLRHVAQKQTIVSTLKALTSFGNKILSIAGSDQIGTGLPVANDTEPLTGRCAGRHNLPYDITGGRGGFGTDGQRFDFITFDSYDKQPARGSVDESGKPAHVRIIARLRSTPSFFSVGYLEILERRNAVSVIFCDNRFSSHRVSTWDSIV